MAFLRVSKYEKTHPLMRCVYCLQMQNIFRLASWCVAFGPS